YYRVGRRARSPAGHAARAGTTSGSAVTARATRITGLPGASPRATFARLHGRGDRSAEGLRGPADSGNGECEGQIPSTDHASVARKRDFRYPPQDPDRSAGGNGQGAA